MKIEVWSDIACPWCYIGAFRLDAALEQFPHKDEVRIVHRSFELNPDHPQNETMPVLEMFARRYAASPAQARAQEGRLREVANDEGLSFSLDREFGNTRRALELTHFAAERGAADDLTRILYRDYFSAEGTVFTVDGLVAIAQKAGLDPDEARVALNEGRYTRAVRADEAKARDYGISGVPFFLIDDMYALSGGQSVTTMLDALTRAWETSAALDSARD